MWLLAHYVSGSLLNFQSLSLMPPRIFEVLQWPMANCGFLLKDDSQNRLERVRECEQDNSPGENFDIDLVSFIK